jgi:hypothetical protein
MSTLAQIRTAIKTTVEAGIPNLLVYDKAGDVSQSPSVVVVPKTEDTKPSFGGTGSIYDFELIVMTERQPIQVAQARLDALVDSGASGSIPRVINAAPTLGLSDVDSFVGKLTDYGKEYVSQGATYIGAVLTIRVIVT